MHTQWGVFHSSQSYFGICIQSDVLRKVEHAVGCWLKSSSFEEVCGWHKKQANDRLGDFGQHMWCLALFRNVYNTSSVSTKRNITNQWHLIEVCCIFNFKDLAFGWPQYGSLPLFWITGLNQTCPCRHLKFVLQLLLSKLLISSSSRKENAMEIHFRIQKFYLFLNQTFYFNTLCQSRTSPHPPTPGPQQALSDQFQICCCIFSIF